MIFYEIRLTRPTLRLVRDPAGRFPLLDKLLNLPFLKQQNSEFSFDLHSLKVDGGDFEVTDQAPSGGEKNGRLSMPNWSSIACAANVCSIFFKVFSGARLPNPVQGWSLISKAPLSKTAPR